MARAGAFYLEVSYGSLGVDCCESGRFLRLAIAEERMEGSRIREVA